MKKQFKNILYKLFDLCALPFILLSLPLLFIVRKYGVSKFPMNKFAFRFFKIFPIRDHYYEPRIQYPADFKSEIRGDLLIDLDIPKQVNYLRSLVFNSELTELSPTKENKGEYFYVNNPNFGPGDSELYYLMIRNKKPKKIIEIGSGYSTHLSLIAAKKNAEDGFPVEIICIEPFEQSWMDSDDQIQLIRKQVESVDLGLFKSLQENDILFIDSSHIIRPGNDVLFEYLHILPILNKGVLIHIHDIFTPRHYRTDWLLNEYRLWNEQYLLEAFLYYNKSFEVLFTLNHLVKEEFEKIEKVLPNIRKESEPSSFWMMKST